MNGKWEVGFGDLSILKRIQISDRMYIKFWCQKNIKKVLPPSTRGLFMEERCLTGLNDNVVYTWVDTMNFFPHNTSVSLVGSNDHISNT